jgi:hypothetical protein
VLALPDGQAAEGWEKIRAFWLWVIDRPSILG